jgi:hypothetical protein
VVTQPNFSGLWQANLGRSHFRAPVPVKLVMKIVHGEEDLQQAVLATRADGSEERQVLSYSMTGAQSDTQVRGVPLKVRTRWNGPEMVIEATVGETVLRDYWSLSEDGLTLTMAHRDDALAGQVTVLERAAHR